LNNFSSAHNILTINNDDEKNVNLNTNTKKKKVFILSDSLSPKGDQPQAINNLIEGVKSNKKKTNFVRCYW